MKRLIASAIALSVIAAPAVAATTTTTTKTSKHVKKSGATLRERQASRTQEVIASVRSGLWLSPQSPLASAARFSEL